MELFRRNCATHLIVLKYIDPRNKGQDLFIADFSQVCCVSVSFLEVYKYLDIDLIDCVCLIFALYAEVTCSYCACL